MADNDHALANAIAAVFMVFWRAYGRDEKDPIDGPRYLEHLSIFAQDCDRHGVTIDELQFAAQDCRDRCTFFPKWNEFLDSVRRYRKEHESDYIGIEVEPATALSAAVVRLVPRNSPEGQAALAARATVQKALAAHGSDGPRNYRQQGERLLAKMEERKEVFRDDR